MRRILCRTSGLLAVVVMLLLGVVATASAQTVEDFQDIAASPVVVTPDDSGRFAILTVDTSIDVACSVVYGTDDSFGLIAVDDDMNGGAHANHHPVMAGLEPGTDYLYRLQGTAPDGTIYVSEVFSFSTPEPSETGPPNLALDATVTGVSSEFSDAFGADNAFDGDPTSEWSSRGDGNDAWVEIDLGAPQAIDAIVFHTRSMNDGTARTREYMVTADGIEIGTFPADVRMRDLGLTAQVLRFDVWSSSGGNTGAVEIEVLGPDA